jgi:hypothetical protein
MYRGTRASASERDRLQVRGRMSHQTMLKKSGRSKTCQTSWISSRMRVIHVRALTARPFSIRKRQRARDHIRTRRHCDLEGDKNRTRIVEDTTTYGAPVKGPRAFKRVPLGDETNT